MDDWRFMLVLMLGLGIWSWSSAYQNSASEANLARLAETMVDKGYSAEDIRCVLHNVDCPKKFQD